MTGQLRFRLGEGRLSHVIQLGNNRWSGLQGQHHKELMKITRRDVTEGCRISIVFCEIRFVGCQRNGTRTQKLMAFFWFEFLPRFHVELHVLNIHIGESLMLICEHHELLKSWHVKFSYRGFEFRLPFLAR